MVPPEKNITIASSQKFDHRSGLFQGEKREEGIWTGERGGAQDTRDGGGVVGQGGRGK